MGENSTFILDIGSDSIKFGYANSIPSMEKNILGKMDSNNISVGMDKEYVYYGNEAWKRYSMLSIKYLMDKNKIIDFTNMEKSIDNILNTKYGSNIIEDNKVILTDNLYNEWKQKEKMANIFFETFDVKEMVIAPSPLLSLYSTSLKSGIVIDSGHGSTQIFPVVDGKKTKLESIKTLSLGGSEIMEQMKLMLSLPNNKLACEAKEKLCEFSLNGSFGDSKIETFVLPDHSTISVKEERYRATEVLFDPINTGSSEKGLSTFFFECLGGYEKTEHHKILSKNVVLTGGTSLIPKFKERLLYEFSKKKLAPTITTTNDGRYSSFKGASVISSVWGEEFWIKKYDYEEEGEQSIFKKSPLDDSSLKTNSSLCESSGEVRFDQIERVVGLHDYNTQEPNKISFKKGEVLFVIDRCFKEWWKACDEKKTRVGLVPSTFVKPITPLKLQIEANSDLEISKKEISRLAKKIEQSQKKLTETLQKEKKHDNEVKNLEKVIKEKNNHLKLLDQQIKEKTRKLEKKLKKEKEYLERKEKEKGSKESPKEVTKEKKDEKTVVVENKPVESSNTQIENNDNTVTNTTSTTKHVSFKGDKGLENELLVSTKNQLQLQIDEKNQSISNLNLEAKKLQKEIENYKKILERKEKRASILPKREEIEKELEIGLPNSETVYVVKEISDVEKVKREFFFSIGLELKMDMIKKGIFINIDLNDIYEKMIDVPYSGWYGYLQQNFQNQIDKK